MTTWISRLIDVLRLFVLLSMTLGLLGTLHFRLMLATPGSEFPVVPVHKFPGLCRVYNLIGALMKILRNLLLVKTLCVVSWLVWKGDMSVMTMTRFVLSTSWSVLVM